MSPNLRVAKNRGRAHIQDIATFAIPPVSSFSSRKAWEKAVWKTLMTHVAAQNSPANISQLLDLILSAGERRNMVLRAATIARIRDGKSYRAIGRELWAAPQMISTLIKALREHPYRSYHERSKTERIKRAYSISPPKKPPPKRVRTKYGIREFSR